MKIKVRWRILKSDGERCETVTEESERPNCGDGKLIGEKIKIWTEAVFLGKGLISIEEDYLVIAKEVTNNAEEKIIHDSENWIDNMIAAIKRNDQFDEC